MIVVNFKGSQFICYCSLDITKIDKKPEKKNNTIAELSGTLGGFGSRDRERSRLEERRKKWIQDLNEQVERKKQVSIQMQLLKGNVYLPMYRLHFHQD